MALELHTKPGCLAFVAETFAYGVFCRFQPAGVEASSVNEQVMYRFNTLGVCVCVCVCARVIKPTKV